MLRLATAGAWCGRARLGVCPQGLRRGLARDCNPQTGWQPRDESHQRRLLVTCQQLRIWFQMIVCTAGIIDSDVSQRWQRYFRILWCRCLRACIRIRTGVCDASLILSSLECECASWCTWTLSYPRKPRCRACAVKTSMSGVCGGEPQVSRDSLLSNSPCQTYQISVFVQSHTGSLGDILRHRSRIQGPTGRHLTATSLRYANTDTAVLSACCRSVYSVRALHLCIQTLQLSCTALRGVPCRHFLPAPDVPCSPGRLVRVPIVLKDKFVL